MLNESLNIDSILIVKTSSLGDIVQGFGVLHALKDSFPHAKIDWVVEKNGWDLVRRHPLINQQFVVDTKEWKKQWFSKKTLNEIKEFFSHLRKKHYDLVIDLQGNCKSGLITLLSRSKKKVGYSLSCVREWPNVLATHFRVKVDQTIPMRSQYLQLLSKIIPQFESYACSSNPLQIFPEEKLKAESLLKNFSAPIDNKLILLCPFAKRKTKELPLDVLADLLNKVGREKDLFLICWSTPEEKEKALFLKKMIKKGSLILDEVYGVGVLVTLMEKAALVIGMDSFLIHLAAYTTSTPTFTFFGPSSSHCYRPRGKHDGFYQKKCPYGYEFRKTCARIRSCKEYPCLQKIDQREAFGALLEIWKED